MAKKHSLHSSRRPRLLDLYCGAGGASMGYRRAGFAVVGVDIKPQSNYPFELVQGDALQLLRWLVGDFNALPRPGWSLRLDEFVAIHASPPCQHYSQATAWRGNRDAHPDLIGPTRELLRATGLPYVIENVEAARGELIDPVMICGDDVGLPIHRRRYFETNWPLVVSGLVVQHEQRRAFMHKQERAYADAMGCDWMSNREARQAIPPAYTERIGRQLVQHALEAVA